MAGARRSGESAPVGAARATAVAVQGPSERLRGAALLHDQLVAKVARRRAVKDALVAGTRQAVTHVAMRMQALFDEAERLDREIHAMLQALADDPARSRTQRAEIARIYRSLEGDVIRPRPARGGPAGTSRKDGPDVDEPRRRRVRAEEQEAFTPSRPRPSERTTLRALFRRLAEALHPDKVQDEGERARRTEVMKQVTVAYQEGDYARLVEIELAWASAPELLDDAADAGEVERRIAVKERAIAELHAQLAALEREIRRLRASEDGKLARAYERHGGAEGRLPDELEADAEVARIRAVRDFIAAFRDGEMSFARFREGPAPDDDGDDGHDDEYDVDVDLRDVAPPEILQMIEDLERMARRGGIDPRDVLRAVQAAAHGAGVGPRSRGPRRRR